MKKRLEFRLNHLIQELAQAIWLKDFVLQDIQVYGAASPAIVSPQQKQERIQMARSYVQFLSTRISSLTQQALIVRLQYDNLPEDVLLSAPIQNRSS